MLKTIHYSAEKPHQKFQSAGKFPDNDTILSNIYSKYPAFKNMGEVTLKSDENFTRENTGVGSIEYFSPEKGREKVTYDNGYVYNHPKPGAHGVVYNPNENDEQDIMLDMLHGMNTDPNYKGHRDEIKKILLGGNRKYDIEREWKEYDTETKGKNDGKESFIESWIDGEIRGLMFEGTPEEFKRKRYYQPARDEAFTDSNLKEKFNQLQNYLRVGNGYMLPEVNIAKHTNGGSFITIRPAKLYKNI